MWGVWPYVSGPPFVRLWPYGTYTYAYTCTCICLSSQLHLRAEGNSETEELQKRVKILQGKLDKQKQQTRELEEAMKSTRPVVGGQVGGASGTSQPLIDSKVSEKGERATERGGKRFFFPSSTNQQKF